MHVCLALILISLLCSLFPHPRKVTFPGISIFLSLPLPVTFIWKNNLCSNNEVGGSDGKESACNIGDPGSISGWGRSSQEGNGSLLQYSYQENSMESGVWQATVHRVTKSQTWLSDQHFHFHFSDTIHKLLESQQNRYASITPKSRNENSYGNTDIELGNLSW